MEPQMQRKIDAVKTYLQEFGRKYKSSNISLLKYVGWNTQSTKARISNTTSKQSPGAFAFRVSDINNLFN
jgi:hypothetical protein